LPLHFRNKTLFSDFSYWKWLFDKGLSMTNSYKTINNSSEGIYKEKGSKFLSFAIPVTNIDEIKQILEQYRK